MIVNVEILEFPEDGDHATGRVIEVLGHPDDFGIDVEIVIRKHHLPHRFPARRAGTGARLFQTVIAAWRAGGSPGFPALDIVTIDGETARDFDDAVWVDRLPNGNYALAGPYRRREPLCPPRLAHRREACLRGTSVYFPDRAVPMLPVELSTEYLFAQTRTSTGWWFRRCWRSIIAGDIVAQEFLPRRDPQRRAHDLYRVSTRCSKAIPALARALQPRWFDRFELMQELALILNRKRVHRGIDRFRYA